VGGVETSSHALASFWSKAGHQVTVVTETPSETERSVDYRVVRCPSLSERLSLIRLHDIIHANGASLKCIAPAWLMAKPCSWKHQAYSLMCVDGAGWVAGEPAPMSPLGSIRHHWRRFGPGTALSGAFKLYLKRFFGRVVRANVYISHHQAARQPFPRPVVIYNPVDTGLFRVSSAAAALNDLASSDASFTYLGRLITEKGVDDLLHALAIVSRTANGSQPTLKVLGDGPEREKLTLLAAELGIQSQVHWKGSVTGPELAGEVKRAGICILPSAWEEPMGNVVFELMSAGKPLIVSQNGALSEIAGDACLTFPNRDRTALAARMTQLLQDPPMQEKLSLASFERFAQFDPEDLYKRYLRLFESMAKP
jgi:glycosyltransferase involved in cell wall biosynthesis